jgi:hypothetical protein
MRFLTTLITFILTSTISLKADWKSDYDELLQKYVTETGVKYHAWHQSKVDRRKMKAVLRGIGIEDVSKESRDSRLAYYLNAYNAWILHKILESYPTNGPGGGGFIGRTRFFRSKSIQVAGQTTSFHLRENDVIRPIFSEPRVHFALNCASMSCPPLHNRAFTAENLDITLNQLSKDFINKNPLGINRKNSKEISISKIFDWYEADFKKNGSVLSYINRFRDRPFAQGTKIRYQAYQWTLNEAK